MSGLVGNPEDQFSRFAAHVFHGLYRFSQSDLDRFLKRHLFFNDTIKLLVDKTKPFSSLLI